MSSHCHHGRAAPQARDGDAPNAAQPARVILKDTALGCIASYGLTVVARLVQHRLQRSVKGGPPTSAADPDPTAVAPGTALV